MNLTIYIGLIPCAEEPTHSHMEVFTTPTARDAWLQAAMRDQGFGLSFTRVLNEPVAIDERMVN